MLIKLMPSPGVRTARRVVHPSRRKGPLNRRGMAYDSMRPTPTNRLGLAYDTAEPDTIEQIVAWARNIIKAMGISDFADADHRWDPCTRDPTDRWPLPGSRIRRTSPSGSGACRRAE